MKTLEFLSLEDTIKNYIKVQNLDHRIFKEKKIFRLKEILPKNVTEADIDLLIEILSNNEEIRKEIQNFEEIVICRINALEQPLNKLIDLINILRNDTISSLSKLSTGYSDFSFEETIIIELKTNMNLNPIEHFHKKNERDLLKTTWHKLQSKNLEETSLSEIVKETITEIKDSHGIDLNYQYVLRILSKFNWAKLSERYTDLNDNFKFLFEQEQITSEYYHFGKAEDLHFYMVKVTQKNAHFWYEFADEQIKKDINKECADGLVAVKPSFDFFDYDKTDVWIAFIANQALIMDQLDSSAIEMLVTMITSDNSLFTSHSGISRCLTYKGNKHFQISADLHSFIANATIKKYGVDKKIYMITCPVAGTREIIIKTFEEFESKDYYIGNGYTSSFFKNISPNEYETKQSQKDIQILKSRLKKQDEEMANDQKNVPLKIAIKPGSSLLCNTIKQCESFELLNHKRETIQTISPEMMRGELAWFCEYDFLLKGQNSELVLLTVRMDALSWFITVDNMVHASEIEMIGDSTLESN